mgnify:CR=1 FL=1
MVVRFGDVPWIDRTLGVDDELLYAPRDSRTIVMDHVLEDLDFACENISRTKDETGSLVTKWVAYALKSRICLFEASFRKYHTELGLTDSADEWYQEAVRAAETVMKESGHSIYTGEGTDASFRSLFISDKPVTSEVMLASCADAGWLCWAKLTGGGLQARTERVSYDPYLCQYFPEYGWDTVYGSCRLRDDGVL